MAKPRKKTTAPKPPAKKAAAPRATFVTIQGPLTLDGALLRCPGQSAASVPRRLKLMISGTEVHASCGERHPAEGRRRSRSDPECFFVLPLLSPAVVRTIAADAEPGRPFAFQLRSGQVVKGKKARTAEAAPKAGAGPAASAHAARAAAARAARTGKAGRTGKAAPAGRGGGALVAGLNTVTALAQAVGQTAGAAGAAISSTAGAVSSTAGAVGKVADFGREGMRTGRSAIEAADNAGARRFARDNRAGDGNKGDSPE